MRVGSSPVGPGDRVPRLDRPWSGFPTDCQGPRFLSRSTSVGSRLAAPCDGPYADAFRVVRSGDTVLIVNAPTVEDLDGVTVQVYQNSGTTLDLAPGGNDTLVTSHRPG